MNRFRSIIVIVVMVLIALPGLASAETPDQADGREGPHNKWLRSIVDHRAKKDHEFKHSVTSPVAAVKRMTTKYKEGHTVYVVTNRREVLLTSHEIGTVEFELKSKDNQWLWIKRSPKVFCTLNQQPVPTNSPLKSGTSIQGDVFFLKVYPSKDKLVLMAFDSNAPQATMFTRLSYYTPNPKFNVDATLEKLPKPKTTKFLTSLKLEKTFFAYAKIKFKIGDKSCSLTAFKFKLKGKDSHLLFIPFGDTTNGAGTYGSGRFIEIPEPKGKSFKFDFNLCFNPLCNYAPVYNCPLPPRENILDVAIKAGETKYIHRKKAAGTPKVDR